MTDAKKIVRKPKRKVGAQRLPYGGILTAHHLRKSDIERELDKTFGVVACSNITPQQLERSLNRVFGKAKKCSCGYPKGHQYCRPRDE